MLDALNELRVLRHQTALFICFSLDLQKGPTAHEHGSCLYPSLKPHEFAQRMVGVGSDSKAQVDVSEFWLGPQEESICLAHPCVESPKSPANWLHQKKRTTVQAL